MQQRYIKGLDGFRAIAILWVMFGHISASLDWQANNFLEKIVTLITNMGWVGVQLFFVISGFLITQILLKDKNKPNFFKNFYMRRSLRIFPIYYLTLFFFFIIIPFVHGIPDWLGETIDIQVWFWLYLQNWVRPFTEHGALAPLWSLAIEEQYYLIWPLLVYLLSNRTLKIVCFVMIISAPLFRFALFEYLPLYWDEENIGKATAYNFTFARWDAIAIGSLIGILIKEERQLLLIKLARIVIIVLPIIVVIQIAVLNNFTSVSSGIGIFNQTTAALIFGSLIILICHAEHSQLALKFLEFSPVKSIGKISYAMYLFHLPLTVIWIDYWQVSFSGMSSFKTLLTVLLHYSTLVLITYCLAFLSWKLFEHPILRFKDKYNS